MIKSKEKIDKWPNISWNEIMLKDNKSNIDKKNSWLVLLFTFV